ncbi:MAG: hypothetical protein IJ736_11285 [Firmicutes bacterium]|nr:hypothetical protein [Bacillota bacterium]
MIKLHFFDYGCGCLNIEKELGIAEDTDEFLIKKIPGLMLEATDNGGDMEDNQIFWFSAEDEEKCIDEIREIIKAHISSRSRMKYTVEVSAMLL